MIKNNWLKFKFVFTLDFTDLKLVLNERYYMNSIYIFTGWSRNKVLLRFNSITLNNQQPESKLKIIQSAER